MAECIANPGPLDNPQGEVAVHINPGIALPPCASTQTPALIRLAFSFLPGVEFRSAESKRLESNQAFFVKEY